MKLLELFAIAILPALVACHVEKVTSLDFFYDTVNTEAYTVVKYYTNWCSHCKHLKPVFEQLSESFQDTTVNVTFLEVDCEAFASTLCDRLPGYPMVEVIKPLAEPTVSSLEAPQEPVETKSWWSKLVAKLNFSRFNSAWYMDLDRVVEFKGSRDFPILKNFIDKIIERTEQEAEVAYILSDRECTNELCKSMRAYLSQIKDTDKEIRKLENILKYNPDEELDVIKRKLDVLRMVNESQGRDNENKGTHDEL
ncbi:LANO_0A05710g1_1 [Lachancea nothofagi CBS 11611]|uniref:LANO_0A05710g1_1 n=1 Tax=Lachancea nothofagi CBS 11611 TaxID=1266666 RepID=A0A1G4IR47_9SACH|nr:LANO_0A05710g1_1 [Lachancea nothofagi CBS 11611]